MTTTNSISITILLSIVARCLAQESTYGETYGEGFAANPQHFMYNGIFTTYPQVRTVINHDKPSSDLILQATRNVVFPQQTREIQTEASNELYQSLKWQHESSSNQETPQFEYEGQSPEPENSAEGGNGERNLGEQNSVLNTETIQESGLKNTAEGQSDVQESSKSTEGLEGTFVSDQGKSKPDRTEVYAVDKVSAEQSSTHSSGIVKDSKTANVQTEASSKSEVVQFSDIMETRKALMANGQYVGKLHQIWNKEALKYNLLKSRNKGDGANSSVNAQVEVSKLQATPSTNAPQAEVSKLQETPRANAPQVEVTNLNETPRAIASQIPVSNAQKTTVVTPGKPVQQASGKSDNVVRKDLNKTAGQTDKKMMNDIPHSGYNQKRLQVSDIGSFNTAWSPPLGVPSNALPSSKWNTKRRLQSPLPMPGSHNVHSNSIWNSAVRGMSSVFNPFLLPSQRRVPTTFRTVNTFNPNQRYKNIPQHAGYNYYNPRSNQHGHLQRYSTGSLSDTLHPTMNQRPAVQDTFARTSEQINSQGRSNSVSGSLPGGGTDASAIRSLLLNKMKSLLESASKSQSAGHAQLTTLDTSSDSTTTSSPWNSFENMGILKTTFPPIQDAPKRYPIPETLQDSVVFPDWKPLRQPVPEPSNLDYDPKSPFPDWRPLRQPVPEPTPVSQSRPEPYSTRNSYAKRLEIPFGRRHAIVEDSPAYGSAHAHRHKARNGTNYKPFNHFTNRLNNIYSPSISPYGIPRTTFRHVRPRLGASRGYPTGSYSPSASIFRMMDYKTPCRNTCRKMCVFGYEMDSNGCRKCACKSKAFFTCPRRYCAHKTLCHVYEKDSFGCLTCKCSVSTYMKSVFSNIMNIHE